MSDDNDKVVQLRPSKGKKNNKPAPPPASEPAPIKEESIAVPLSPIDELIQLGADQARIEKHKTEKWPDPVDGAALANQIIGFIGEFVVLPRHADTILTNLVFASYLYHTSALQYAPRVVIRAPDPNCGKTTLMEVLSGIVFKSHTTMDFTAATYAEFCHANHTMLLDEIHNIAGSANKSRLFAMINAGHSPKFAVKETLKTDCDLDTIVIMGGIGNYSTVEINSRAYEIDMLPKLEVERVRKYIERDEAALAREVTAKLFRWTLDNAVIVRDARPEIDHDFNNRERDNALTLLQIAEVIGPEWADRTREALRVFKKKGAQTDGQVLFADMAKLIREQALIVRPLKHAGEFLFTDEIVAALVAWFPDRQCYDGWASTGPWKLRNIMRGYQIEGDQQRKPGGTKADRPWGGYYMRNLEPWFQRYSLPLTKEPAEPSQAETEPVATPTPEHPEPAEPETALMRDTPSEAVAEMPPSEVITAEPAIEYRGRTYRVSNAWSENPRISAHVAAAFNGWRKTPQHERRLQPTSALFQKILARARQRVQ